MPLPSYIFRPKTSSLTAHRRFQLDRYANIAQASQLVLHLTLFAFNALTSRLPSDSKPADESHKGDHAANPDLKKPHPTRAFLGRRLGRSYGTYGQWVFGTVWTAWLAGLCFAETGNGMFFFLTPHHSITYQCVASRFPSDRKW
jgi:hypothetical protein